MKLGSGPAVAADVLHDLDVACARSVAASGEPRADRHGTTGRR